MVARSGRNTQRRNRRNHAEQCGNPNLSGRGFYRAFFGRLATRRRASRSALAAILALPLLSAALVTPAAADQIYSTPSRNTSFEEAKTAYDEGDKGLALAYGRTAADNGDVEAQILVGHILMRGETGLIDYNGAADVFHKAALKDHPDALAALAELGLRSQGGLTPKDAVPFLERAAALGRLDAMRILADVYQNGEALPKDLKKTQYWRGKAANEGDALAARAMGDEAIEKDAFEALTWYEHAATLGDPQSAYIAAIMYAENFDIRPDGKKAAILMQQAAKANLAPAMADYGLLVYQGAGVEKNVTSAAKWFERAAKAGDSEGQFLYAFTLAKGEGLTQSYEDAYYWLLRSGESGVDDYDDDRRVLRERLEANVPSEDLARARSRFERTLPK